MKSISSVDIHYLVQEFQYLVNARVDKLFMPEKKELLLQLHIPGKGKQILRLIAGKLFYVTDFKPEQTTPSGFCMYLRKHITGRLREIKQLDAERIVELVFENRAGFISLIFEFFSKGNIIVAKDNIILNAAERQNWKDRTVKTKETYIHPKQKYNFKTITEKELKDLLNTSTKESIVKTLALELGLGGQYAEELCRNIDKNQRPNNADPKQLFKEIEQLRKKQPNLNRQFNELYTKEVQQLIHETAIKPQTKAKNKYDKIIETQTETIQKLKQQDKENTTIGEKIYENYQLIQDTINSIKKAMEKHSLQEIQKRLKDHALVKQVDPKNKTITIEL